MHVKFVRPDKLSWMQYAGDNHDAERFRRFKCKDEQHWTGSTGPVAYVMTGRALIQGAAHGVRSIGVGAVPTTSDCCSQS